ncbi:olfactory receptor 14A16-like [Agelaius phoeniceus]|uniref:olfactory receptor 14A16-like n=1 Tax=Agelaius phoeniceus TaxID=39638 RepID=UPI004055316F
MWSLTEGLVELLQVRVTTMLLDYLFLDNGARIPSPLALQLAKVFLPLFDNGDSQVQQLSMTVFQTLMSAVEEEGKTPLMTQVCQSLLPLLFHCHDEKLQVAETSRETLLCAVKFLERKDLEKTVEKEKLSKFAELLDRYVSICKPLHYGTLLGSRACAHVAAAAWASAFLNALMHTANTFSLPLCYGNAAGQFFCEIPQILKLSCSHRNSLREMGLIAVITCLCFGCFVFIVFSYVQIFRAVLRIPSEQGQHKAFSTCLPHLAVVSLFLSTGLFSYLKPASMSSPSLDLALSVLYSVVPPALNPLIYSLRNQELKAAVWTLMTGWFQKH